MKEQSFIFNIENRLPKIYEPRLSLMQQFEELSDKRIIFVSAPAGYGKTISTLLWLQQHQRPYLWISLDEAANIPSLFYRLLGKSLLAFQPKNKRLADILKQDDFSAAPVEHFIQMIDDLEPVQDNYLLVLDDMHLITNEAVTKSLFIIQQRLPHNLQLLILSRQHITPLFWESLGKDRCGLIAADQLAFSPLEIEHLYQKHGYALTADKSQEICQTSHGWPIEIATYAQKGYIGEENQLMLTDFIEKYLWKNWAPHLQDFMLKTTIANELEPEICNELSGRSNSAELLQELSLCNSFLYQTKKDHYHYHQLFLDFLMKKAAAQLKLGPLHAVAANFYLDRKDYVRGCTHAIKSENEETILRTMVTSNQLQSPSIDEYILFGKLINTAEIPDEICEKYPVLYTFHISYSYLIFDDESLYKYYDKLQEALPLIAENFTEHYLTCHLEFLSDHRKPIGPLIHSINELINRSYAPDEDLAMEMFSITCQLPLLHQSMRDLGDLQDEVVINEAQQLFERLMKVNGKVFVLAVRCGLCLEKNDLNAAWELASEIRIHLSACSNPEITYAAMVLLAEDYQAFDQVEERDKMIADIEKYLFEKKVSHFYPNVLAYKTKLNCWSGDSQAAQKWLANYFVHEEDTLLFHKLFQYFTTVRAYIVSEQFDKALQLLNQLEPKLHEFNRTFELTEAYVLRAIAEWSLYQTKEAEDSLAWALNNMAEYEYINTIANEGAAVLPILNSLRNNGQQKSFSNEFLHKVTVATLNISKKYPGLTVTKKKPIKLSKQQLKMLNFLDQGLSYTEIAAQSGLTIHTIKSHVSAAYSKLGVRTAEDALAKAKTMKLLS